MGNSEVLAKANKALKRRSYLSRLLLLGLVLVLMVLVGACGSYACYREIKIPPLDTSPTPTVPPSFVTFTDEFGIFSISYPPEWAFNFEQMPEEKKKLDEGLDEIVKEKQSGSYFQAGFLLAGRPRYSWGGGFSPRLWVWAERLSITFEREREVEINQMRSSEVFRVHRVAKILVGGHEAILVEGERSADYRWISISIPDSSLLWAVNCDIDVPATEADLQDCEAAVRSFRILLQ